MEKADIWARLAAPLPEGVISWRQDGRPVQRDGKYFARFVCYIDANTVRERLDAVVPGEWDLTLDLLPPLSGGDEAGEAIRSELGQSASLDGKRGKRQRNQARHDSILVEVVGRCGWSWSSVVSRCCS